MTGPTNVLVGIDLSRIDRPTVEALGPVGESVVRRALWLARAGGARLTFFSALAEQPWHLLDEADSASALSAGEGLARQALRELVRLAHEQGAHAEAELAPGTAWSEIVKKVERDRHDLVLVGSRDLGRFRRMLFGGTSLRLLHHCPCPVWAGKAGPGSGPLQALVASNLSPASDEALRLALRLTDLSGGSVHLLHVVDYPVDRIWSTGLPDERAAAYHRSVRAQAEAGLQAQLERCGGAGRRVPTHLADSDGLPDHAILKFLHERPIDLLAVGTEARGGLDRALLGNPVERLLPDVPCSVLAARAPRP